MVKFINNKIFETINLKIIFTYKRIKLYIYLFLFKNNKLFF
jgi:hypothetical protein